MKTAFLFILFSMSFSAFSMEVLISYFDPFGGKNKNNSEVFAKKLLENPDLSHLNIKLCQLRTVFDKAFLELDDCIRSMEKSPDMIISLGEAGCKNIKIETRATNLDRSRGSDNDGVSRDNEVIYPDIEKYLGVTLPLEKSYCSLSNKAKKRMEISSSAGSFVCNNTLFHGLAKLSIPYTFIHVPTVRCASAKWNVKELSSYLASFVKGLADNLNAAEVQPKNSSEVEILLNSNVSGCEKTFYQKLKETY